MEFSEGQWEQIQHGFDNDLDVSAYVNPALSVEQMQEIRTRLGDNTPLPEPTVGIDHRSSYGYTNHELIADFE